MTDRELMQMALDALEAGVKISPNSELHERFRAALAQPEPEPVFAFRRKGLNDFCTCTQDRYNELAQKPNLFEVKKFYTAPPQREWKSITGDEIWDEWCEQAKPERNTRNFVAAFARAIEGKLKEKNQ